MSDQDQNGKPGGPIKFILAIPGAKTFLSMILFAVVFAFATSQPWGVAIGFTVGLLIHELGHMLAFWYYQMKTTPPVFMPFVGAVIEMKEEAPDVYAEAWIGLGGPLAGTAAALLAYVGFELTESQAWLNIALLCFGLNLMNLLPMSPLDGGHITGAIWRGIWVLGVICIALLAALTGSTMLMIALLVGFTEINRKVIQLPPAIWALLVLAIAANGLYWESYWACIPLAFAYLAAGSNFAKRRVMLHVADRKGNADERFQLFYSAMRKHRALKNVPEDEAREHWQANFNGKAWSSVTTSFKDNATGAQYELTFVNTGYFDIKPWKRLLIGSIYVALASVLVCMIWQGLGHLQIEALQTALIVFRA